MSETVDLTKIRVGDEVLVRLEVAGVSLGNLPWFNIGGSASHEALLGDRPLWIGGDAIVSHTPKPVPLAVGDRVTSNGHLATVLATHGGDAWIVFDREPQTAHVRPIRMLEPSNA